MATIVSLCKRRGLIFPSSEIYDGFSGFWDYGPLGVELKNNLKQAWWQDMVHRREDVARVQHVAHEDEDGKHAERRRVPASAARGKELP